MSLIEGIGDEVTLLFAVGIILVIVMLAWVSTSIQEIPFFSVIIVELTQRRRRNNVVEPQRENEQPNLTHDNSPDRMNESDNGTGTVNDNTSISNENNVDISNTSQDTDVETTVQFLDILDNENRELENRAQILQEIQGGSLVDGQVESSHEVQRSNISENQGHLQTTAEGQGLSVPDPVSENSQTFSDTQEENISETELRRRRVAFFDHKRDRIEQISPKNASSENFPRGDNQGSSSITSVSDGFERSVGGCEQTAGRTSDKMEELTPSLGNSSNDKEKQINTESIQSERTLQDTSQSAEGFQQTSDSNLEEEMNLGDGKIRIRLKYLNDTQRNVVASPTDTVGQFRRAHFASELAENKLVRFIFHGRDLRSDSTTLDSYNVVDNSVLHCLVTQTNRETPPPRVDTDGGFDMGTIMLPVFGVILCILWYLRFEYRQFFSATSTISLFGITSLYVAAVLASWESHRRGNTHDHID